MLLLYHLFNNLSRARCRFWIIIFMIGCKWTIPKPTGVNGRCGRRCMTDRTNLRHCKIILINSLRYVCVNKLDNSFYGIFLWVKGTVNYKGGDILGGPESHFNGVFGLVRV